MVRKRIPRIKIFDLFLREQEPFSWSYWRKILKILNAKREWIKGIPERSMFYEIWFLGSFTKRELLYSFLKVGNTVCLSELITLFTCIILESASSVVQVRHRLFSIWFSPLGGIRVCSSRHLQDRVRIGVYSSGQESPGLGPCLHFNVYFSVENSMQTGCQETCIKKKRRGGIETPTFTHF